MTDSGTGSKWQQLTGECFEGPLKGKRLPRVSFLYTTWGEWRKQHPQTLALVPEPAYKDNYAIMAKRNSTLPSDLKQAPERGSLREDPRLPNYEQVVGVDVGDGQKAYPVAVVRKLAVVNDKVGSTPVLLVHSASSDTTTVFYRQTEVYPQ